MDNNLNNNNNVELNSKNEDKINKLAENPEVRKLVKDILEKIARKKRYKKNSIEMLQELQKNLKEILQKDKENEKDDLENKNI